MLQGVGALAGDVVQAEEGEGAPGDGGPYGKRDQAQAADTGQQHDRQEANDQQQGAEQQGLGRGPSRRPVRGPVQPEQAEALGQADADAEGAEGRGRGAEAVPAGGFAGVDHSVPLRMPGQPAPISPRASRGFLVQSPCRVQSGLSFRPVRV